MVDAIRQIGASEAIFYRRHREHGGTKVDQIKCLKELEKENDPLRKAVSDLTPDKLNFTWAARENFSILLADDTVLIWCVAGLACPNALPVSFLVSTVRRNAIYAEAQRTRPV